MTLLDRFERVATALIRKYKPKVVCITGSVGKTSTKEAVASALSASFSVRKTSRNYNNDIGVPITIIGGFESEEGIFTLLSMLMYGLWQLYVSNSFPEVLVIEVGAGKIGEIKRISSWLKPDIVVITNMPDMPSHLGVFKTKEAIIREKKYLVDAMDADGLLMVDDDEPNTEFFSDGFRGGTVNYSGSKMLQRSEYQVTYRKENGFLYPTGFNMSANVNGDVRRLTFEGFIGTQNIKAILIAVQIARRFNCPIEDIVDGIQKYKPEAGRLRIISGSDKSLCVIDDSFNASPYAVENSLRTLLSLNTEPGQRRIAVLGDMHNLGPEESKIHNLTAAKEIGRVDILITVGNISSTWQNHNADKLNLNRHFKNSMNAARYLLHIMKEGDIILFKGGHLTRLEKAIALITGCDNKLLVRQERYYRTHELDLNPESNDHDQQKI